ncbi:hypothetical protein SOM61_25380 [Massilia sp. CFBP9012]|uniref:hypothetical protein n=1 Tax=Massilia sp. CFBP9012 TaxID=3096531 RepID=UPI002A69A7D1|nr:hypothetical protein [Massilia sp. CFBP9012]MDY0978302.1 hypothetical protein [Massilia sp. CFBP9012]
MTTNFSSPYQPINCEFHDLLEAHATLGKPVQIGIRNETGAIQYYTASITDLYAKNGAEYMSMSTGDTVRLDQIEEIDGAKLSDF